MAKKGIYGKYIVKKADGSKCDPNAVYFVLRLDTDAAARKAMSTYADDCSNKQLAKEIRGYLDSLVDGLLGMPIRYPPELTCKY